jgi:predicted small lipoprotein YifL
MKGWTWLLLALMLVQPLAACGKKGDLEAPEGAHPNAPRAPDPRDERGYRS